MKQQTATIVTKSMGGFEISRFQGVAGMPVYGEAETPHPERVRILGLTVELPENHMGHKTQIVLLTEYDFRQRAGRVIVSPQYGRIEIFADE